VSQERPGQVLPANTRVVACQVFEPEFRDLGLVEDQVIYLDQGLHRYPKDLRKRLDHELASLAGQPGVERVILGYGLCSGGLDGICSHRLELVLPLAHDCVPLLLGAASPTILPGGGASFYLSLGWIDYGKTPLTEYYLAVEHFGPEDAMWVAKQMHKDFAEVVLIKTKAGINELHREYARRMARLFGLAFREVEDRDQKLADLMAARGSSSVALLPPGQLIKPDLYPQATTPALCQGEKAAAAPCTNS
jgi:hypothetical protein